MKTRSGTVNFSLTHYFLFFVPHTGLQISLNPCARRVTVTNVIVTAEIGSGGFTSACHTQPRTAECGTSSSLRAASPSVSYILATIPSLNPAWFLAATSIIAALPRGL